MTLPQNVKDALESADANGGLALVYIERCGYKAIRDHLINQEAEIDRMKRALGWHEREGMTTGAVPSDYHHSVKVARDAAELAESRLAAANALLRECHCYFEARGVDSRTIGESLSLNEKIQSHLQGAGDE